MICPKCGREIVGAPSPRWCPYCGYDTFKEGGIIMKLKLKIHDKNTDRLIDGDTIQNIEFSRDKPKCFYTDEDGYTVYTNNFEMIVEFLLFKPINLEK